MYLPSPCWSGTIPNSHTRIFPLDVLSYKNCLKQTEAFRASTKVPTSLTLILKEQHLHAIKGEGLAEAVRHGVLLLLENFSDL